jgi:hypothetical protein
MQEHIIYQLVNYIQQIDSEEIKSNKLEIWSLQISSFQRNSSS